MDITETRKPATDEAIAAKTNHRNRVSVYLDSVREDIRWGRVVHMRWLTRKPIKRGGVWVVRDLGRYRALDVVETTYTFDDGKVHTSVHFGLSE